MLHQPLRCGLISTVYLSGTYDPTAGRRPRLVGQRQYLWEHSRIASIDFPETYYRDEVEPLDDPNRVPLCKSPDQFIIVVGGGAGRHSMYLPTFAASYSVTREIAP